MASPIVFRSQGGATVGDVDTYINNTFYGGLSEAEGIDLRQEMRWILYGSLTRKPKGHWIAYRRYDRCTPSQFWNKRTKEGVGGPAYEYTDEALRTRRVPTGKRSDQLDPLKAGVEISDMYTYYFEYTVNPKIGDEIYELTLNNHAPTSVTLANIPYAEKFRIKRVHPYRLENGNVQYWAAIAQFDEITY